MNKVYIKDFCEDLNYREVVLFVDSEIDLDDLYGRLKRDNLSHLYRFESVRENRLFYIENCDLQDVTINPGWNELLELVENDYSILQLKKDHDGFYVVTPDILK